MDDHSEKLSSVAGRHGVLLPAHALSVAMQQKVLLRGLIVAGAGYYPKPEGPLFQSAQGADHAIFIYCVKGGGWCEMCGQRLPVREGDLLVIPPHVPHACGSHASAPWSIHWVHAMGLHVPEYLKELGVTPKTPVVRMGDDMQLALLFNQVLRGIEHGFSFLDLLYSSHALAHLLAVMIQRRHEVNPDAADGLQRVARTIEYMSEHLSEPLKVSSLAALASLSPAHFTALFKEQTGCAPRDYLHLLRIHKASRLLHDSALNIKDIAAMLGYQDQFHFSRKFKAFNGVSPTEYRAGRR